MTEDSDPLAAFRRLLDTAARQPDGGAVTLTDTLVGPARGALLRRCAVPQDFDIALLRQIGELDLAQAQACYEQFAELSIIQINDQSLSIHERWRQPLWRWWQDDAQRAEFSALNERLVRWFAAMPASATGEDPAARRRMFHLLGCRPAEGMALFEAQFREARHRGRFSECTLLLRLAREHEPLLHPRDRARLSYQEGKLASDLRRWSEAETLLRAVADDAHADPRLRVNARVRVGHALRQRGQTDAALAWLEPMREPVAADPATAASGWRVLYELGEVYRDLGRADDAVQTLQAALSTMVEKDEDFDRPGMLNALGTAQLKLRDSEAAVASFGASLGLLQSAGDALRGASVLNNLALAQLERCDWAAAESSLSASMKGKQAAGDLAGQATVWFNLSRTQTAQEHLADALQSAERAAAVYGAVADSRGQARAQLAVGRLLRRVGRKADAAAMLAALVRDATAAGDAATAQSAQSELELCAAQRTMPLWGWALITVAAILVILGMAAD